VLFRSPHSIVAADESDEARSARGRLAGDACLITAGAFGLLTAVAGGLVLGGVLPPVGSGPPTVAGALMASVLLILSLGGVVVGPVAAWLLHGRRIDVAAVVGAGAGIVGGILAVQGLVLLAMLSSEATRLVANGELLGPLAVLVLVGLGFVALMVWQDIDAVRDLSAARGEHRRLDIIRIVCTILFVVFAATVIGINVANPKSEIGEAAIFATAGGVFAGVLTAVADVVVSIAERRRRAF